MLKIKKSLLVTAVIALAAPTVAMAQTATSGAVFYDMVFGNPNIRKAVKDRNDRNDLRAESCESYSDGSLLNIVNNFFCHMEKDMGIKGVGSVTKTFAPPGQSGMTVRAEIAQTAVTINSVSYDYQGKVWVCSASCTSAANFNRAFYIAFSYNTGSGINKGYVLTSPGSFNSSQSGSAMEIEYDIGSGTVTQSVKAKAVFVHSSATHKMRALGQKTSSSVKVNVAFHDGTNGRRFAMATSPGFTANKYFNMYFEGSGGGGTNGFYSLDAAGIAAPSTSNGFCVSAAETGTALAPTSVTASNCSSLSFLAFDHTSNGAAPKVIDFTASSILGTWQGMSANPSSI